MMKKLKPILIGLFLLLTTHILAQEIKQYQWENRVLILLTETTTNPVYQSQILELQSVQSELELRKVLVISLGPNFQKEGLNSAHKQRSELSYANLKTEGSSFEVLLFGLDGYIKLRQQEFLRHQDLFDLIDAMPMRRYEMQNDPSKRE